jgi:hypothetical protein
METTFILPKLLRRDGQIAKIGRFLALLKQDKAWRITVEEAKSTRSIQQCRFLNGVIYKVLMDATGYERDDVSDYCCGLMWGWKDKRVPKTPRNPTGVESVPCRTTTTDENGKRDVLKWDAFADYVAFLQRHFAQEHGIYLPDPDPNWREHEDAQEAA